MQGSKARRDDSVARMILTGTQFDTDNMTLQTIVEQ